MLCFYFLLCYKNVIIYYHCLFVMAMAIISYSARMNPENTHKLMGGFILLGVIL